MTDRCAIAIIEGYAEKPQCPCTPRIIRISDAIVNQSDVSGTAGFLAIFAGAFRIVSPNRQGSITAGFWELFSRESCPRGFCAVSSRLRRCLCLFSVLSRFECCAVLWWLRMMVDAACGSCPVKALCLREWWVPDLEMMMFRDAL